MTETKVKIRNEVGLHLRPAQQLCTKAMEYIQFSMGIYLINNYE